MTAMGSPTDPTPDPARRRAWLAGRRAAVRDVYDDEAAAYDENPYPRASHASFVERLLATCPPGGLVLDAPCGTGAFFAQVRAAGRRVVGIDQSSGMLAQARATGLADRLEQVGLQELAFRDAFDASMTVDAMENIPPEDWPVVLANLHRAVRPGSFLYLTVEEVDEAAVDAAYADLRSRDLPVVRGEIVEGDVAGYHYYPGRGRVLGWIGAQDLELVDEAFDQEDGWGYRHLLLRSR